MKNRVCAVFLLCTGSIAAQFDAGTVLQHVKVRVAFANGICDVSTHVRLMALSGPVAEATANDQCEVEFQKVPAGTYHLSVSGQNFNDTENVITASIGSTEFEVMVKRANDPVRVASSPASAFVTAADLAIPARAQKEFDKSNELMDRQDFTKALQRLNTAIAI